MTYKNPYSIIKNIRVTEKSLVLENLKNAESNPSLKKCSSPKYVFEVDPKANKTEIAGAVEEIYKDRNIRVVAVNTINVKAKSRRVRGHAGRTSAFKKAVVTLQQGDSLEIV
jgi:large subunit ribosomal protein L23